ncbi:MAG TPA: hypothetical protein VFG35_29590, partial [Actinoplanes sp.]|nr:hypothetical protein [Actinoplanes sp.]
MIDSPAVRRDGPGLTRAGVVPGRRLIATRAGARPSRPKRSPACGARTTGRRQVSPGPLDI